MKITIFISFFKNEYFQSKIDKFQSSSYNFKNRFDNTICIPVNYSIDFQWEISVNIYGGRGKGLTIFYFASVCKGLLLPHLSPSMVYIFMTISYQSKTF